MRMTRAIPGLMGGMTAVLALLAPAPLPAQHAGGRITGVAVSADGGETVRALEIRLENLDSGVIDTASTDSIGTFGFPDIPSGRYRLWVAGLEELRSAGTASVDSGEVIDVRVTVSRPAYVVEDLEVTVRTPRWKKRLVGFERRRRRGNGYFLGPEEIAEARARQSTDLLRRVPGLRVGGDGTPEVSVRVGRTIRECQPTIWINGHPLMDYNFNDIPLDGLLAVEVFRGRSEIPARFLVPGGGQCAAVVAWIRAGPAPASRRRY